MKIIIKKKSNSFSNPEYISKLADFIVAQIDNKTLISLFSFIVLKLPTIDKFRNYKQNFVPSSTEESQMIELINNFYEESAKVGDVDNKRGDLLECLTSKLIDKGQYQHHKKHKNAVLAVVDHEGTEQATINPHDIDFYLEEIPNNTPADFATDCKVKVFEKSDQLKVFDSFAKKLSELSMSCKVGIIHLVEEEIWIKKYTTWFENLSFIGPNDFKNTFSI